MDSLRITKKHHRHLNNPFPLPPRTLPFLQGTLLLEPTSALLSTGVFPIGQDFQLTWSSKNGGCFSISHRSQPAKSIWSTVPGQAFVSAAVAETEVEESRGSFLVKDRKVHLLCDHQTVEGISKINNLQSLFQADEHDFPSGFLELEQNDVKDMKFPVLGISGRIFSKNKKRLRHFSTRMSGHIQAKEASISVTNYSSCLQWSITITISSFSIARSLQIYGNSVQGRLLHGSSPTELIEQFTENIGRPPELPEWIISGAVIGMQGGTDKVYNVWNELKAYDIPISAFWLQDWVGQRETFIGSQLWWNWEVDTRRYWGWRKLIQDLDAQHIKMMTYCNPCLAPIDDKPNKRRILFEEAKNLGILVKDKSGKPYMVPNTAFDVGMLDLTHPNTASWFKRILQEMVDGGVRGWMADFGEGLPVDATLYSGEDPITAHNRYPELWARINREFVDEWKSNHGEDEDTPVFFMRAGFRDSPKWVMLFWEGDQMVSWQANDGIKSAVVGLLSSGLSGYAFNHSDIGGYCAVSFPLIKYQRSEELLLRWMELNSLTTVFRTHEGNKPTCNSQFYSNQKTLSHFARFAKVYRAWKFYRIQLIKEAAQKGLPVCRHMFLHYPDDETVQGFTYQQFLVGTEILVVPVLDKGKNTVKAYFPKGESCPWKHIWTGNLYANQEAWVEAPIGYPAVFVKVGSTVGETFLKNLRDLKIL